MEIRQAGNTFMKMRRRINNYVSQRTNFLTGISHDLGTILTRIKLGLELINDEKQTKPIKKDIKTMEMLLREYLDFSEKVKIKNLSNINIKELIEEVIVSSSTLKKEQKYFVHQEFSLRPIKIVSTELFSIYLKMHLSLGKIFPFMQLKSLKL